MAKIPGQPFYTIEIPPPNVWNRVQLRDWYRGEHEHCYQWQPAYSTLNLYKELKTRSNRRNRRPSTIMIAPPSFCQKKRLDLKWQLHLQNAASNGIEYNVCSYLVRTSKETVCRNRKTLKPTTPPKPAKSYPMPPSHAAEKTVQISPEATGTQQTRDSQYH